MKPLVLSAILISALLVIACAETDTPIPITPGSYALSCRKAELRGQLSNAEQLCQQALVNDNPKVMSQRLFDLGRIKRKLSKFPEAESLIKKSLAVDASFSGLPKVVAYRKIELAAALTGQGKWAESKILLDEILPIAPQLSKSEQLITSQTLKQHSQYLTSIHQDVIAGRYRTIAAILE